MTRRSARASSKLIGDGDVRSTAVGTAREALDALQAGRFDCMVLDLRLPDMGGLELIETNRTRPSLHKLPIVVYAAGDLVRDQAPRAGGAGRIGHHQGGEVSGAPPG